MATEATRSIGCFHAAANSGCRVSSITVRRTDVMAVKILIQQSPAAARSTICGGSLAAIGLGLSNGPEDIPWILMIKPFDP